MMGLSFRYFRNGKKRWIVLGSGLLLITSYQNCARIGVSDISQPSISVNSLGGVVDPTDANANSETETDNQTGSHIDQTGSHIGQTGSHIDQTGSHIGQTGPGTESMGPQIDPNSSVICANFAKDPECNPTSTTGLIGNVYHNTGSATLRMQDYLKNEFRLNATLILSNLNIPWRTFTQGFPTENGYLMDKEGKNRLIEFFALDLAGYFRLPAEMQDGDYEFLIRSDDGAILTLNGRDVITNDGYHSASSTADRNTKCTAEPVRLNNQKVSMRLRYFQGPKQDIALQVFYRSTRDRNRPCDLGPSRIGESPKPTGENGWIAIPSSALSHNL